MIVINILMSIATALAVGLVGYVVIDITVQLIKSEKAALAAEAPVANVEPVVILPEPEAVAEPTVEVEPEIVEHIDAQEADSMLSDKAAMLKANYEKGAGHGKQGIINIGVIDANFDADDVITLASLKQKGLVPKSIGRIKILADGILNKPLTIKAESYSVQAIKMIELTGGTVIILKD